MFLVKFGYEQIYGIILKIAKTEKYPKYFSTLIYISQSTIMHRFLLFYFTALELTQFFLIEQRYEKISKIIKFQ